MHQSGSRKNKVENMFKVPHQTKSQRRDNFTLDKKVSLIHDVLIGKNKLDDARKKYGITRGYANQLVLKFKWNPTLLRELIDKHDLAQQKEQQI